MKHKSLPKLEHLELECLTLHEGICPIKKNTDCPYATANGNHMMNLRQRIAREKRKTFNEEYDQTIHSSTGLTSINLLSFYNNLPEEIKKLIEEYPEHFKKEHEKYNLFIGKYLRKKDFIHHFKRIIVIGVGSPIEINQHYEPCKNEILAFIEAGFIEKLLLIGLRGNDLIVPNTEKTKEAKYKMFKFIGIKDDQIIKTWVDGETPLLISYSEENTLILVLLDGKKQTSNAEFLKALIEKRPTSTIDFLGSRNIHIKLLEEKIGKDIKIFAKWTQPSPHIYLYRIQNNKNL